MFAVRSSHVVEVIKEVRTAENSLWHQSQSDAIQRDHSDGWGVVSYHGAGLRWVRHAEAAYRDPRFDEVGKASRGRTVVAHVRRASKGLISVENSHPFVLGRWTFAHNGTLTALERLRPWMMSTIPVHSRSQILGQTDSELIFHWLMPRLIAARAVEGGQCRSLAKLRTTLAKSLLELDRRNAALEAEHTPPSVARLNVILTNGSVLAGSRLRNSLSVLERQTRSDFGRPRRTVAVASEPTDRRAWREVPDFSVYSISSQLQWVCEPMAA